MMKSVNASVTRISLLLAEDDPNDVFFITRAFLIAGLEVDLHVAKDGQEAIEYLQRATPLLDSVGCLPRPDVMVLDVKMPRMNGFEVLEWVAQQPEWKDLPIVVLSSSNLPQDVERAYALGADIYGVKPNDPGELVALVQRFATLCNRAVRTANHRMALA